MISVVTRHFPYYNAIIIVQGGVMYITNLEIHNFGILKDVCFQFDKNNINFIIGENASGKTTILTALYTLFYTDACIQYPQESTASYQIKATLHHKQDTFLISKYHKESETWVSMNTLKTATAISDFIDHSFFLIDGEFLRWQRSFSKQDIQYALKFFQLYGYDNIHFQTIKNRLENIGDRPVFLSGGEQFLIQLICIFSKLPKNSVVFGDGLFSRVDSNMLQSLIYLLKQMSHIQFVFLESISALKTIENNKDINLQYLKRPLTKIDDTLILLNRESSSKISFAIKKLANNTALESLQIINYYLNTQITSEECLTCEFKEVHGNNTCDSIVRNAEIYTVAFLNSSKVEKGTILFGIDDNRFVKGVKLSYSERDTIRRTVSELFNKIDPHISSEIYEIEFKEIMDAEGIISDLFIVEIKIEKQNSEFLYSTSKNEVYKKTPGGRIKLTSKQIQEEYALRHKPRY